jgi:hypothetical protein
LRLLGGGVGALALGLALVGSLLQLLELLRLFGARLAIAFCALLPVIRLECHGRSFPESMSITIRSAAALLIVVAGEAYTRSPDKASAPRAPQMRGHFPLQKPSRVPGAAQPEVLRC